jgi:hypothetical protein
MYVVTSMEAPLVVAFEVEAINLDLKYEEDKP